MLLQLKAKEEQQNSTNIVVKLSIVVCAVQKEEATKKAHKNESAAGSQSGVRARVKPNALATCKLVASEQARAAKEDE